MNNKYKLFAPGYYRDFRCIADKCRHSCCIDWEIDIDGDTLSKYSRLGDSVMSTLEEKDGCASFILSPDGRCPHLRCDGLCSLIIEHGEGALSQICRDHPRFFNDIGCRREAGLGIVCEEACRLVLESNDPFTLYEIGESCTEPIRSEFDPTPERERIYEIIRSKELGLRDKIKRLRDRYSLSMIHSLGEWLTLMSELEILDPEWERLILERKTQDTAPPTTELEFPLEGLLSYFIYRHVSAAKSHDDLRARVGFAILSLEVICHLTFTVDHPTRDTLAEIARLYSAEIEYSEDNTAEILFEIESSI